MSEELDSSIYIKRIFDDIHVLRNLVTELLSAVREAESEVPEKMRRFMMYMHDVHDVRNMYVEHGHSVPPHVDREMERCDDRYRQLLKELSTEGGTFEKVRREMAKDPENRYDHAKQLMKPKET